jgi:hypothetical protein
MCDFNNCDKKPMPGALIYALGKLGLQRKSNVLDTFGEPGRFCASCAVKFAARVAVRAGVLDPAALDANMRKPGQVKSVSRVAKAQESPKHYPAGADARRRRLAEIQASMRKTTITKRDPNELYQQNSAPPRRSQRRDQVSQRIRLWHYLRSKGLDPVRIGNW